MIASKHSPIGLYQAHSKCLLEFVSNLSFLSWACHIDYAHFEIHSISFYFDDDFFVRLENGRLSLWSMPKHGLKFEQPSFFDLFQKKVIIFVRFAGSLNKVKKNYLRACQHVIKEIHFWCFFSSQFFVMIFSRFHHSVLSFDAIFREGSKTNDWKISKI